MPQKRCHMTTEGWEFHSGMLKTSPSPYSHRRARGSVANSILGKHGRDEGQGEAVDGQRAHKRPCGAQRGA